ncbi:MAG TPA: GTP cyclohydrolase I [Actinoplanes sp.]|nr:GTP cyclohydrolase I [Actinoplanes sp.]
MQSAIEHDADQPDAEGRPDALEGIARMLLTELGEDPNRDGLRDTPARYARWWREFMHYEPGNTGTLFETSTFGQTVVVSDIGVWSLCEHHLLPFFCSVTIAYVPTNRILGLSKFARIAHDQAHRLQVQERLTNDIAADIVKIADASDVAVITRGEHLCMTMRGIRSSAVMTSTAWTGAFQENPAMRAELFALIGGGTSQWRA